MTQQPKQGQELIKEIETAEAVPPRLWWLGHCGFAIKYYDIIFYLDPLLSNTGPSASPLDPEAVTHADLIICSHAHPGHMDPESLNGILAASPRAKLVLPKSAAAHANAMGISYHRMTTTDSDLRVEFFKNGVYARIYAAPSAHPELNWTPLGGYPFLGYLIRCGEWTLYHAGDGVPYDGLAARLRPFNVTVAMLPVSGRAHGNFTVEEAAQLAAEIQARWLVPMHYQPEPSEDGDIARFINHMLFHYPAQRFKVFQCGEGWQIPPREQE